MSTVGSDLSYRKNPGLDCAFSKKARKKVVDLHISNLSFCALFSKSAAQNVKKLNNLNGLK